MLRTPNSFYLLFAIATQTLPGDDFMKKTTDPQRLLRVALYIRVSSDEQAERGDSIRDQKERGIKYINDHNNMLFQDIHLDDGVSGQKQERLYVYPTVWNSKRLRKEYYEHRYWKYFNIPK